MFAVRLPHHTQLALQAEEIADERCFISNEAAAAFPAAKQREVFEA